MGVPSSSSSFVVNNTRFVSWGLVVSVTRDVSTSFTHVGVDRTVTSSHGFVQLVIVPSVFEADLRGFIGIEDCDVVGAGI